MSNRRCFETGRGEVARLSAAVTNGLSICALLVVGCGGGGAETSWQCALPAGADGGVVGAASVPDFLSQIGCLSDFEALASEPLDATIPGARSGKVVLDQFPGTSTPADTLYFQNSERFQIHYQFAAKDLTGPEHPQVEPMSSFSSTEYSSLDRRFVLGAVTYYEGPKLWALELAPYDTAGADMIAKLYDAVKANAYFGKELVFHPTSEAVEAVAAQLPSRIPIKTTDEIYAQIDYQPLNLATTIGQLKFYAAADLGKSDTYVGYRDVVVLDHIPNDISVVAGMITQDFQTPLSHVNVLAQNRHTPNMGLRNATTSATLLALKDKWVQLRVGAIDWEIHEVTQAEADAWWEANKPPRIDLPPINLSVTDLRNVGDLVVEDPATPKLLKDEIQTAILAFGTKASNYGVIYNTGLDSAGKVLSLAKDPDGHFINDPQDSKVVYRVPIRPGFAIPVFYYHQFMTENGFYDRVDTLLADPSFVSDPAVRDTALAQLRADIIAAPVNQQFSALLHGKLDAEYPGMTMRFRTSTNAEDLDGFPCAGCYDSHTGDPADWDGSLLRAIKEAWSGVWFFRTFEERQYHSIDHKAVAMALLVHHNFPEEAANGVALTSNPYDPDGLDQPAFYVNVQYGGEAEVVAPPDGVTSDEFLYYYYTTPNRPITYLAHSNLIQLSDTPGYETVLDPAQIVQLGTALDALHRRFSYAYGPNAADPNTGFYAMDCELKFTAEDNPGSQPTLWLKQARPNNGRGE